MCASNKIRLASFFTVLIMISCAHAYQSYYDKGNLAYDRGEITEAIKEWKRGAEEGEPKSQYELALSYSKGEGVIKDDQEAVKWYRKAAEQNDGASQNNLGLMYNEGRGVEKNDNEAAKWFYRAASNGSLAGIFHLALSYEKGRGVPQDYHNAVNTYLEAAKRGYVPAQVNLGLLYAKNVLGFPQENSLAYKWLSIAILHLNGDKKDSVNTIIEKIKERLSTIERDNMDNVIRDWKAESVLKGSE